MLVDLKRKKRKKIDEKKWANGIVDDLFDHLLPLNSPSKLALDCQPTFCWSGLAPQVMGELGIDEAYLDGGKWE